MPRVLKSAFACAAFAALAACQYEAPQSVSETPEAPNIVVAVCGDCHGVRAPFLSPNPQAPAFDAIANRPGLTEDTLASWLVDAHNYPELMEFELNDEEAKKIADYMITLRREDYRPTPQ